MRKKIHTTPLLDLFLLSEEKEIEDTKKAYLEVTNKLLEPKYTPIGKYPAVMLVIKNHNGKEVSHWSCESSNADKLRLLSEKDGRTAKIYQMNDYWENYKAGKFELS